MEDKRLPFGGDGGCLVATPESKRRIVALVPAACDIVHALGCTHLLVGHAHPPCDAESSEKLQVCTESKLGSDQSFSSTEAHIATATLEALLWEAEYGSFALSATLIEWALAPYRVCPTKLQELNPDIIVTQIGRIATLAKVEAAVEDLFSRKVRVVHIDPKCLDDVWRDITLVALEIGVNRKGQRLVESLKGRIDVVKGISTGRPRKRVLCLQWSNPLLATGPWVSNLIQLAGGIDIGSPLQVLSWDSIFKLAPEILVFANFGWDLNQTYQEVAKLAKDGILDSIKLSELLVIAVADGTCLFSRPGPRLVESLEALAEILHPESQPFGHSNSLWRTVEFRSYGKGAGDLRQ